MKQAVLPAVLLLALCTGACTSKELSRSKAEQSIKDALFGQQPTQSASRKVLLAFHRNMPMNDSDMAFMRKFQNAGWITMSVHRCANAPINCADAELTDKGKEKTKTWQKNMWGNWEVDMWKREFVRITGVLSQMPGFAMAQYTWRWTPNDLGKEIGLESMAPEEATANFQRFDDGWRLVH